MTTIDSSASAPPIRRMRVAPLILPVLFGLNALAMLIAGQLWYASTPGVTETGPYNAHFVADIGVAFAAVTASLLMGLLPLPHARLFVLPGAIFLIGHALVHLAGFLHHGPPAGALAIATEVIAIYLPAWVAGALSDRSCPRWRQRSDPRRRCSKPASAPPNASWA